LAKVDTRKEIAKTYPHGTRTDLTGGKSSGSDTRDIKPLDNNVKRVGKVNTRTGGESSA